MMTILGLGAGSGLGDGAAWVDLAGWRGVVRRAGVELSGVVWDGAADLSGVCGLSAEERGWGGGVCAGGAGVLCGVRGGECGAGFAQTGGGGGCGPDGEAVAGGGYYAGFGTGFDFLMGGFAAVGWMRQARRVL